MFELRLRALLASLAVHVEASVVEEPGSLNDAGEWGVGLEWLCDTLYDHQIAVFPGEVAEIEALAREMGLPHRAWQLIHELQIPPVDPPDSGQ